MAISRAEELRRLGGNGSDIRKRIASIGWWALRERMLRTEKRTYVFANLARFMAMCLLDDNGDVITPLAKKQHLARNQRDMQKLYGGILTKVSE